MANLSTHIKIVQKGIINFLFPPRCIGCRAWDVWICDACFHSIKAMSPKACAACGRMLGKSTASLFCESCERSQACNVFTFGLHQGVLRESLHALKYDGIEELHAPLSALLARKLLDLYGENCKHIALIPVPLHHKRQLERGFNQTELLAKTTSSLLGCWYAPILERHKETAVQMSLDRDERLKNVQQAFGAFPTIIPECIKGFCIIDDVATTGATVQACATALKPLGKSIQGVVLAHGHF